nr:transporter substrate-binding domain-containing protein [uncultured Holophaga sp.]
MDLRTIFRTALISLLLAGTTLLAGDLEEVRARGVLRHLGVPYANFVSGSGDGMDTELTQRFAAYLGVKYEFVPETWGTIIPDLTGRTFKLSGGEVEFLGGTPVKGDIIATGFTILAWRKKLVDFSEPTFPSQIWLVARADSRLRPIKPSGNLEKDIARTRAMMQGKSVLSMEKTCLDPSLYDLAGAGAKVICFKGQLNEIAPAILRREAELTILDVPDALVALQKWRGRLKVLGPITGPQEMGAAFPKDAPRLREAYNTFLIKIRSDGTYQRIVLKYYPTAPQSFPGFFRGNS